MITDNLRKRTEILENDIKTLVSSFIQEIGVCEIDIRTNMQFVQERLSKEKELVGLNVKVSITI